jgi:hypothetical protein
MDMAGHEFRCARCPSQDRAPANAIGPLLAQRADVWEQDGVAVAGRLRLRQRRLWVRRMTDVDHHGLESIDRFFED